MFGGLVGYLSYDFVRTLEYIGGDEENSGFPLFEFGLYNDFIRFDNFNKRVHYFSHREDRSALINDILSCNPIMEPMKLNKIECNFSKEDYKDAVKKCKEYIYSGDIFQVVLSKRYEAVFKGDLFQVYNNMRRTNPSPYMYFIDFGKEGRRQIVGASPENLISIEGKKIDSSATLAGTRPRGRTIEEDKKLEHELLHDEKEIAEHIMLVDLTRNDVGRVSAIGTVKVPKFKEVKKFSHVQHISSHVSGVIKDGKDCFDAVKSIFPAGTLSGAPKIRAMQIINELEPVARGPYGGAVGYFGFNGNADFGICIRTAVADNDRIYMQSGAGIVVDSVPEKEHEETEHKIKIVLNSLESKLSI